MELTSKSYKICKTKNYIKTSNLFFFFNGINCNSKDWLIKEQNVKMANFSYYKVFNKIVMMSIQKSVYCTIYPTLAGVVFFIKSKISNKFLSKKIVLNKLESLLFILLAVKLNNKVYSPKLVKKINFLEYKDNNLFLFQCLITNLKFSSKKLKNRNNVI